MKTVKVKAYAKINLTLDIVGTEAGYHALDSLVASVDLYDEIVLRPRRGARSSVVMHGMGSESIPPEENNALKAAEAFSAAFGTDGTNIVVYKNIPMGAGMGGSSADTAGVLNGMARLYGVNDQVRLKQLADELGSDTGYMLTGGFARMQGRGDKVTPLDISARLWFLCICPDSGVSAGSCYRAYDTMAHENVPLFTEKCIEKLSTNDINGVGRYLTNALYAPAASLNEDVARAYSEASSFSPLGVTMTGSGSCVIALFETRELCEWAKSRYRGKYRCFVVSTVSPPSLTKKRRFWRNPFALQTDETPQ